MNQVSPQRTSDQETLRALRNLSDLIDEGHSSVVEEAKRLGIIGSDINQEISDRIEEINLRLGSTEKPSVVTREVPQAARDSEDTDLSSSNINVGVHRYEPSGLATPYFIRIQQLVKSHCDAIMEMVERASHGPSSSVLECNWRLKDRSVLTALAFIHGPDDQPIAVEHHIFKKDAPSRSRGSMANTPTHLSNCEMELSLYDVDTGVTIGHFTRHLHITPEHYEALSGRRTPTEVMSGMVPPRSGDQIEERLVYLLEAGIEKDVTGVDLEKRSPKTLFEEKTSRSEGERNGTVWAVRNFGVPLSHLTGGAPWVTAFSEVSSRSFVEDLLKQDNFTVLLDHCSRGADFDSYIYCPGDIRNRTHSSGFRGASRRG